MAQNELITTGEAAAIVGVCEATIRRDYRFHGLPVYRRSGSRSLRLRRAEVLSYYTAEVGPFPSGPPVGLTARRVDDCSVGELKARRR